MTTAIIFIACFVVLGSIVFIFTVSWSQDIDQYMSREWLIKNRKK